MSFLLRKQCIYRQITIKSCVNKNIINNYVV